MFMIEVFKDNLNTEIEIYCQFTQGCKVYCITLTVTKRHHEYYNDYQVTMSMLCRKDLGHLNFLFVLVGVTSVICDCSQFA